MSSGVLVQKQAGPENLAFASDMSSCFRGPEIQVWTDQQHEDALEVYREKQKPERSEYLSIASNMSSSLKGSETQVWEDWELQPFRETLDGSDGGFSTLCNKKRNTKKVSKPRRPNQDKENVDPSFLANQSSAAVPSWLRRYPLQDITSLIHLLQSFDIESEAKDVGISRRSEMKEARDCRNGCSFALKNPDPKRSRLLQMR